jgi:release factor glutamine methyltransferase
LVAPDGGTVLDLCCGTGAIGAFVAHRRPDLTVHCADVDPAATALAAANLAAAERARPRSTPVTGRVHAGDLFGALPPSAPAFDVVVANVPYVPRAEIATLPREARDHEPRAALDGGHDGLDLARRVRDGARAHLHPRGVVLIEASPAQAATLAAETRAAGGRASVRRHDDGTCVVRMRPAPGLPTPTVLG